MANLKEKVLGSVSGGLGDIIFRNVKGKNVISMKPASFNTPQDPGSVARRGKFLMVVKLAASINSNVQLKSIWKQFGPSGLSIINTLVKTNYLNVTPDDINDSMLLVPSGGFGITPVSVDKTADQVVIDLQAIGTASGIDTGIEKKLRLMMILFLKSPVIVENTAPYAFISLSSGILNTSLTVPLTFTALLMSNQSLLFNQYQESKVFFALVTLNEQEDLIRHSISLFG